MAVKIRLTRTGSKNAAAFRVVAADSRAPRDGRFLEILGWYDPKLETNKCKIKLDRVEHWRAQGAEISDTVKSLLKQQQAGADAVADAPVVEETVAPVAEAEVASDTAESEATSEAADETDEGEEEKVEASA